MKGISMRDLAKELNVSVASVSVALRGKEGISEETRAQILEAAKKHGYDMNRLSKEKSKGIIEIIDFYCYKSLRKTGYTHPYYYTFIDSAKKGILEQGYTPAGPYCPEDDNFITRPEAVGSILFCAPTRSTLNWWKKSGKTFVVSALIDDEPVTTVAHDNFYAIYTSVNHLKELGHTNIGYIQSMTENIGNTRYASYLTYMNKYHLTIAEHLCVSMNIITPDYNQASLELQEMLASQMPLKATAFICDTDYVALSLMRALRNLGMTPGKDISVVGFDDMPLAAVAEPPLTTIRSHESEVAYACVEQLVFNIENPHAKLHRHVRIGTEFIVRESTCRLDSHNK